MMITVLTSTVRSAVTCPHPFEKTPNVLPVRGSILHHPICSVFPLPDPARVYEAAGNPDSALATYERYVATPWLYRL